MTDDLRADFNQLLAQACQRPQFRRLGQRQRPHEVAEIVGQCMELKADGIGGEGDLAPHVANLAKASARHGGAMVRHDSRAHWAAVYANKDFVEGFASKFRPLLITQE
jgi:hypothetical protein